MMKYSILFFLCSIGIQAQTFEGTIGKYEIFLGLDIYYDHNVATAYYFYKSQLQNISLEGTYTSSELILFKKFSEKNEEKELFTLSINEDKITGTWKNDGQILKVDLTKTSKSIYDYKIMNLEFVRDSITIHDEKELVWLTEKYSKKTLFRLGNGFTLSERNFMNPNLDTIQSIFAIIGLDCSWSDINIEVQLITNQYISFNEFSSIYCGGAHPNHYTQGYNFDMQNKIQLINLSDLYPNLNHFQLLKNKYESFSDNESDCNYFIEGEQNWDYYTWVLTKNGVTITPSFPHTLDSCESGFPLTYKELEQNYSEKK